LSYLIEGKIESLKCFACETTDYSRIVAGREVIYMPDWAYTFR